MANPKPIPEPDSDLYVSSVEGHLVSRFGTARPGVGNQLIGASKAPKIGKDDKPITGPDGSVLDWVLAWHTDEITWIPAAEHERFFREYRRAIEDGALTVRTKAEFEAARAAARAKSNETKVKAAQPAPEASAPSPAPAAPEAVEAPTA